MQAIQHAKSNQAVPVLKICKCDYYIFKVIGPDNDEKMNLLIFNKFCASFEGFEVP